MDKNFVLRKTKLSKVLKRLHEICLLVWKKSSEKPSINIHVLQAEKLGDRSDCKDQEERRRQGASIHRLRTFT